MSTSPEPQQQPEEQQEEVQERDEAYYEIFGGDSDLSDVDGYDDDDAPSPPAARVPAIPLRDAQQELEEEEEEEEDKEVRGTGDDGEYRAEKDVLKGLKFTKKAGKRVEREEGEEEPRKKKKKNKSKEVVEEEEEEEVDQDVVRRRDLDARIEAIIKRPKSQSNRKKGRGRADEDDLDLMNDQMVTKLRQDMETAANEDIDENERGSFAFHKLQMLDRVVETLQKATLAESLVDNGLLEVMKRWLEPLPDRSLPALNIQRAIFESLCTLSIETSALKACGLGKIVYFYTKCKRVHPPIARMANQLVSDWMRPIIRRSKAFSDKEIVRAESGAHGGGAQRRAAVSAKKDVIGGNESIARRHARIPEMLTASFKVAPAADVKDRAGPQQQSQGSLGVTVKMKGYKKKLLAGQQASRRV